jgi:class 3 adenylate cyclase
MRPITALFADIVGSTRLGERLAPDEVKALVGECISRMSRAVEEFGDRISVSKRLPATTKRPNQRPPGSFGSHGDAARI